MLKKIYKIQVNKFFQNAFDKIGNQGNVLGEVAENTRESADAIAVGGDLYEKINELTEAVTDIQEGKGGGGGLQNAMAIALVSPSMEPLGKGLQFVVDAVNSLQGTGDEIKAKTEALVGGLTLLGDVGKSILQFAGYLALATPLLLIAVLGAPLLALSLFVLTTAIRVSTKKLDKEQLEKVQMLGDVGKSILILVGTLALASFIAPFAMKALIPTMLIFGAFALLSVILPPKRVDQIEKVGKGMLSVALGIGALMLVLALTSFLVVPAIKGAFGAMLVIGVIGFAFFLLEKMGVIDNMEKAGKGLLFAAGAILGLGIALALFDIITPNLTVLLSIGLVVLTVGLFFGIIGMFDKQIEGGARALLWAALSIVVMGLALLFFTKVIGANMGGEDVANSFVPLLLIGLIAAAFGVAGIFKSQIMGGATALIVGGIALIIIGVGVLIISKALGDKPLARVGAVMAAVGGLALVFGAAGIPVVAGFIALGAGAMVIAGVALITIGAGLLVMSKAYESGKKMIEPVNGKPGLVSILDAVASGFKMFPWTAAGILLGAGALTMAGIALITIGKGVNQFKKLGLTGSELGKIGASISLMIGTLAVPFQKIGAGEEMEVLDGDGNKTKVKFGGGGGGLFGLGGTNPVAMGIQSVLRMGTALTNIAGGVQSMANLKFPTGFDKEGKATAFETIGGDAFKKVIKNTMMMVGSLAVPFAQIGAGGKQPVLMPDGKRYLIDLGSPSPGGLMGFLKGGGAVQKGVKSVMNMGQAISNLAGGVQDMAMLKFPIGFDEEGKATGYRVFGTEDAQKVTDNTQMLVGALSTTFSKIGGDPDANDGSWWGGESTIEKGISIVAGIGEPLLNLAKGVEAMSKLRFPIYDKDGKITGYNTIKNAKDLKGTVGKNTQLLIEALTDTLTTIGKDGEGSSSWWQGTNNFEKGIEIVTMIGEPYKVLGESVKDIIETVGKMDSKSFAGKIQDIIGVFTGDAAMAADPMSLVFRKNFVIAVGESFEKLGKSVPSITQALANFKVEQGKAFFNAFVGPVAEGDEANGYNNQKLMWKAIGTAMVQTKDSMPGITSAINGMDMEKLVESRKMFEALAVLGEGGDPGDILAAMGESLEVALQNLADMLGEFQSSVAENSATTGGALSGLTDGIKKMAGVGGSGAPSNSGGGGDNEDVVRAVRQLQTALTSQGIKVKSSGGFFG
jgi:hypothetical protein